jgi:hypothetical protein
MYQVKETNPNYRGKVLFRSSMRKKSIGRIYGQLVPPFGGPPFGQYEGLLKFRLRF